MRPLSLTTHSGHRLALAPLRVTQYRPLSRLEQVATGKLFAAVQPLQERKSQ